MAKGGREQWDILSFCSRGEKIADLVLTILFTRVMDKVQF